MALGLLKQKAEGELRLTLHPEKTRITTFGRGLDFLGFTFKSQHRVARKRALEKFKDKEAEKYGVSGTPTFFVNGRKVIGAMSSDQMNRIIQEELAKVSGK